MFYVHCTEDVLAETISSLRNLRPTMSGAEITTLRRHLIGALDELVDDFDATIEYPGSDPDDLHVHAAAVACRADILLSDDKGFAGNDQLRYEVFTSDDFFALIDDSAPWLVRRTVREINQYWQKRQQTSQHGLLASLSAAGCPNFAKRVERHLRVLSGAEPEERSDQG